MNYMKKLLYIGFILFISCTKQSTEEILVQIPVEEATVNTSLQIIQRYKQNDISEENSKLIDFVNKNRASSWLIKSKYDFEGSLHRGTELLKVNDVMRMDTNSIEYSGKKQNYNKIYQEIWTDEDLWRNTTGSGTRGLSFADFDINNMALFIEIFGASSDENDFGLVSAFYYINENTIIIDDCYGYKYLAVRE